MAFWFRDVISEGTVQILYSPVILSNYSLNTAKAISQEEIEQTLINFSTQPENTNLRKAYLNNDQAQPASARQIFGLGRGK